MDFRGWMEGVGAAEYVPPRDAQHLLFDFYSLNQMSAHRSAVGTDRDRDLEFNIQQAYARLLPYLREQLLQVLGYGLLSESQHFPYWGYFIGAHHAPQGADPEQAGMGFEDRAGVEDILYALSGSVVWERRPRAGSMHGPAAGATIRFPGVDQMAKLVPGLKRLFEMPVWERDYGGPRWAAGCDAWLRLYQARSPQDQAVWIDHIYDLQHNSGQILDKVPAYQGVWLKYALDHKRESQFLDFLLQRASPFVRAMGQRLVMAGDRRAYMQPPPRQDFQAYRNFNNELWQARRRDSAQKSYQQFWKNDQSQVDR